MNNYSIANLDITPFIALSAYSSGSYFDRIFRPWLNLGGEPCPVGPRDDNPRFSFKSLIPRARRAKYE